MDVLAIIQQAAMALGFPRPRTIEDSSDSTSMRLLSCLNRALEDIVRQYKWQACEFVRSYTATISPTGRILAYDHDPASTKPKLIEPLIDPRDVMQNIRAGIPTHVLTDYGFTGFINNYIFNATTKQYIKAVPLNEYLNHFMESQAGTSSAPEFTIYQDKVCFSPLLKEGEKIILSYRFNYVVNVAKPTAMSSGTSFEDNFVFQPSNYVVNAAKPTAKRKAPKSYSYSFGIPHRLRSSMLLASSSPTAKEKEKAKEKGLELEKKKKKELEKERGWKI